MTSRKCFGDDLDGMGELLLGDDKRRLYAQNITLLTAHTDEYASFAADRLDLRCFCWGRFLGAAISH
jgi:hypothetical protein